MRHNIFIQLFLKPLFLVLFIFSCNTNESPSQDACAQPSGGNRTITVTWNTSRSFDVQSAGGGHKIYYNSQPGVTKSTPYVVDVPNSDSATSGTITGLKSGCKVYVRVGAYSAIHPAGGKLSPESSINP